MGLSGSKLYRLSGGTVIPASEALYPAEPIFSSLLQKIRNCCSAPPMRASAFTCCVENSPCAMLQMGQPFSPLTISSLTKTVFPCSSR